MSKRRNGGARDTAKDIILGLEPSGQGPRRPKEGIANPPSRKVRSVSPMPKQNSRSRQYPSQTPSIKSPTQTVIVQKPDTAAINDLQHQLQQLQRQQNELLAAEQQARRRLQASQEALSRKLASSDNAASNRDLEELRRQLVNFENKIMLLSQDVSAMKGAVDRHSNDIMTVNNDMKSRAAVDPAKLANSSQNMDMKLRDFHGQLMQLKQTMDAEIADRIRVNQTQADSINRLQEYIRQQDTNKNDILQNLSRKGDIDQKKLNEESKRINDKIQLITTEVNRNTSERDQRLRDEINHKYNSLQALIKTDVDNRSDGERENKRKLEENMKTMSDTVENMKSTQQADKIKNKERFQKINEALATLEQHLEMGDKKVDKIVNAEIQARKLHEKALLAKVQELEDRVNKYLDGLNKALDDAKSGKENVKVPTLDTDALRREMEAIAADKNKMSMEGLLKLEEKMSRVQQARGLTRDKREMHDKVNDLMNKDQFNKLKSQVNKLDQLMDDVEKAQEKVRDKLERQIPQDLNELSAKADNIKQQLNARIDQEEEERYLAIRELQEAYNNLLGRPGASAAPETSGTPLRREVDECKVAIKKLAESVTTVKNVLDRKLQEEVRKREQDFERLSAHINR